MSTDTESRLRRQLRAAKQKGPIQSRLEKVASTSLVPYVGAIGLGYTAERFGEQKGQLATLAASAGGLLALVLLNPKSGSAVEIVASGIAGAGVSVIGLEHGRVAGRMHMAKMSMQEAQAEEEKNAQALEADTRDADILNIEERTVTDDAVAQGG
jgi:hypothetical protein